MLISPKFAFALTIFFLALCSCGSLNSAKIEPKKKTSAINSAPGTDSVSVLTSACVAQGGRMSADGFVCLKKITKFLAPSDANNRPDLVIEPSFLHGMYIVATAGPTSPANAVEILYDGRAFARVPARMQGDIGLLPSGRPLTFYVNTPNYKDVTVTVWTCYSGTITNRVICPPAQIPGS